MGSVAHFRQAMLDSEHLEKLEYLLRITRQATRPASIRPPRPSRPPGAKKLPVWWEGDTRDEIHRALDLAEEFGTTAVLVGGREAAKVVDRLKASKVPVVLRLNFSAEPKVPTDEEYQKKSRAERDEPFRLLAQRKSEWKKQVGTAAALAKAGVPFAFSVEGIERIDSFPARCAAHRGGAFGGRCPRRLDAERRGNRLASAAGSAPSNRESSVT